MKQNHAMSDESCKATKIDIYLKSRQISKLDFNQLEDSALPNHGYWLDMP